MSYGGDLIGANRKFFSVRDYSGTIHPPRSNEKLLWPGRETNRQSHFPCEAMQIINFLLQEVEMWCFTNVQSNVSYL